MSAGNGSRPASASDVPARRPRRAYRRRQGPAAARAHRHTPHRRGRDPSDSRRRSRPRRTCAPPHTAQVSRTGPNPSPPSRPTSNTRNRSALAPSRREAEGRRATRRNHRLHLPWRAQLTDQLDPIGAVGHARDVGAEPRRGSRRVEALQRGEVSARAFAHPRLADRAQPQATREPLLALARAARQRRDASRCRDRTTSRCGRTRHSSPHATRSRAWTATTSSPDGDAPDTGRPRAR